MDDFSRLEAKLVKLRQRERSPGDRRSIRGVPEALLALIVSEIDETILPREIGFTAQNGASFHLAVANRRLQALVSGAPAAEGLDALLGVAIADAEDATLGQLRSVLLDLLSAGETWAISSRRQSGDGFPSDIGVPSGPLARAWQVAEAGSVQANPGGTLGDYLATAGSRSVAWLLIEDEAVKGQFGPDAIIADLSDKAAIFLDGYFSRKDALFQGEAGPNGLVFAAMKDGPAMVFLDCGASMAFLLASATEAATLARDWQARVAL